MKFKPLLDRWKKDLPPLRTARAYAVQLPLDDASRLHALIELFPGRTLEEIVTDLLHVGLDEIESAMPYEPGPKIISRDDHGDPVYEDIGMTPRFVELSRALKKSLASEQTLEKKPPSARSNGSRKARPRAKPRQSRRT